MTSLEKINSLHFGNGPAIIMLHGWNRSLSDLKPLGDILAEYSTVHLLDLPGFGGSSPPPEEGWDTKQYAGLVFAYIKSQGLEKVTLLGHSFGGRISLRLCVEHPELVDRLILIDSHGLRPTRTLYQNMRVASIKRLAKVVQFIDKHFGLNIYRDKFAKRFGSPDYLNAGILKNTFVKTISEDQSGDVQKIKAKTLLIWGSEDKETPVAMGEKFSQLIKDSKLIIVEGKDHNPFHGLGAQLCANYIIKFITQ